MPDLCAVIDCHSIAMVDLLVTVQPDGPDFTAKASVCLVHAPTSGPSNFNGVPVHGYASIGVKVTNA